MKKENKEYTYCPDCHSDDSKGYRGKRCKWCCALLIENPLNKFFIDSQSKPEEKKELCEVEKVYTVWCGGENCGTCKECFEELK